MNLRATAQGLSFAVHAKPRAAKSRVVGVKDGALEVQLAAPPVDGAANAELVRLLAHVLGVPRRDVSLVRGEGSRHKQVGVAGLDEAELRARLEAAVGG